MAPLVYDELRRLAGRYFERESAGHTLQATALVNEAYLRLFAGEAPVAGDREHFLALAATAMRRVLVDHARSRSAVKRGGGRGVNVDAGHRARAGRDGRGVRLGRGGRPARAPWPPSTREPRASSSCVSLAV